MKQCVNCESFEYSENYTSPFDNIQGCNICIHPQAPRDNRISVNYYYKIMSWCPLKEKEK